jgi:hypothetical protein
MEATSPILHVPTFSLQEKHIVLTSTTLTITVAIATTYNPYAE